MVTRAVIDDFVGHKKLALVGIKRGGTGFGHAAFKELLARGYDVRPVHRVAEAFEGRPCAHSLAEVAGEVEGVVLVTAPEETEALVREAREAGIARVWIQQGAESDAAIRYCEEQGMSVVHHECVLMFADNPAWFHRAHRWLKGAIGRLPS